MEEKSFAAGVDRDIVMECKKIGMDTGEFSSLCLEAMQGIAEDLELY